ncbi:MAG: T9SS type A sorting domain-containing protein [Ferruginibacter sp.]
MQEKITSTARIFNFRIVVLSILLGGLFSLQTKAQNFCANELVIYSENFGGGTSATGSPEVDVTGGLIFQPADFLNDGYYRVVNNTQQRGEWHSAPDHTGNNDGKMLVVNGTNQTFFRKEITSTTSNFLPGSYGASLFLMNVNTPGTCSPNPLLPTITFMVEYNTSATGTTGWVSLQSSTANAVAQSATPTWIQLGGVFDLPVIAARIRLTLSDGVVSGCGNDFAIDDIKFATCPAGGPLPVQFLKITATEKGAGVAVNWSTASESNNRYFSVERSIDQGNSWTLLNTVNTSGNSNLQKDYNIYDPKPAAGANFYRVKQVDIDGNFKYSSTAKVNIKADKTAISILQNPIVNNTITIDFVTTSNTYMFIRLLDVTGKLVATEKLAVAKGSSRHTMQSLPNLGKGMYIIAISDENGNLLYNNKLMK